MAESVLYDAAALRRYAERFLIHFEVPADDARVMGDILVTADERGIDSHGVTRLYTYYGRRLERKTTDPASPTRVVKETPTTLLLDGGNGLGPVVAHRAMTRCLEKAKEMGLALVSVRNSNHFGIAGYYAMMALPHGMIGVSLTNSQPFVAPTYSRAGILGTNPIAVAVPAGNERPFVLDMATSIVSLGKIQVHSKAKEAIPLGWGIAKSGEQTESPDAVLDKGALQPLGGPDYLRGYKGYGLALLVDILSGVLSGAATGPHVGRPTDDGIANVGHFFLALRVDAIRDLGLFQDGMDGLIREMKDAAKVPGQDRVYIHGEKEFERAKRSAAEGVPVLKAAVEQLTAVGADIGVPFDLDPVARRAK
ncbi:MAG: Ldh family oxidoreductase [Candidatus Bipolaricaulota bacterium]|nr:Ldh family oxidoreductase [Candidatus Bipolaricaulota bacterium]